VESFKVCDILPATPAQYRLHYKNVDVSSSVEVGSKYRDSSSGHHYFSSFSIGARQKNRNLAKRSDMITYLASSTKTVGSGRKVKYAEQETFVVETIVLKSETENLLSKQALYYLLISKFVHENEADQTEWEKKMQIYSGNVSPSLSQWLSRVLLRHRFSVRKESISQTFPLNWLQICIDACGLIRLIMKSANVTRLIKPLMVAHAYVREKGVYIFLTTNEKWKILFADAINQFVLLKRMYLKNSQWIKKAWWIIRTTNDVSPCIN
jgi:hypothetical protein